MARSWDWATTKFWRQSRKIPARETNRKAPARFKSGSAAEKRSVDGGRGVSDCVLGLRLRMSAVDAAYPRSHEEFHETHSTAGLCVHELLNDRIVVETHRITALIRPWFQERHLPSIVPTASSMPPSAVSGHHAIDPDSLCPHGRHAKIHEPSDRNREGIGEPAPEVTRPVWLRHTIGMPQRWERSIL